MIELTTIYRLTCINLKSRYRGTVMGFAWVILHPILLLTVQTYIFSNILKTHHQNYDIYLLCGLFPWLFATQAVDASCNHLRSHSQMMLNLNIKPSTLIWSLVLEYYFNFLSASCIVTAFLAFRNVDSIIPILTMLLFSVPFIFFVYSTSLIAAVMHTLYKDVKFVLNFLFTILFFSSPIIYFKEDLPSEIQSIMQLNPMIHFLKIFRYNYFENSVSATDVFYYIFMVTSSVLLSQIIWKKLRNQFLLKI